MQYKQFNNTKLLHCGYGWCNWPHAFWDCMSIACFQTLHLYGFLCWCCLKVLCDFV